MVIMYKLNFKKRVWVVKQYLNKVPTSKIVLAQNISRMSVSNIIRKYNQSGWDGLKDHKTGRSENILNQTAVIIILDLRKRLHMSLNYRTPKEVWDELVNVKQFRDNR